MAVIILTPRQAQAVEHVSGPMLVVAGAGTGKTTVLVERAARLIERGEADPSQILAITYTKNAARELRERVEERLREQGVGARDCDGLASNFHSWCYQLLQRTGQQFRVVDETELWIYLRRRIESGDLKLERFIRAASPGQFLVDLLEFFNRCHDELVDAAGYRRYVGEVSAGRLGLPRVAKSGEDLSRDEVLGRCGEIAEVFESVERMMAADKLGTFGQMITRAVGVLRTNPALLAEEQARVRFLLIDEFQDANLAQIELASLLAGRRRNIFAVGDPDQAIYQFRGASSAAFSEYLRRYPDAAVVNLVENRRSTTPVLAAAFACISRNPAPELVRREPLGSAREEEAARKGKPLKPRSVEVVLAADAMWEAADVAEQILARRPGLRCRCRGLKHFGGWCNFTVLYRMHQHREAVIEELAARSVPFVVVGQDARETREVRDAMAVLRVIESALDSVSLVRVAALPRFEVSPEDLRQAMATQPRRTPAAPALERVRGGGEVLAAIAEAREAGRARTLSASGVLALAAERFGLPESEPLAILRDFVERWEQRPTTTGRTLSEFLDYMRWFTEYGRGRLVSDEDSEEAAAAADAVRLMTAHAAKGLEFSEVFLIRANTGSFPVNHREKLFEFPPELRQCEPAAAEAKALHREEERRLFYVAMTRARDGLTISARRAEGKNPHPPGFVREILGAPAAKGAVRVRGADAIQMEMAAAAEPLPAISQWVGMAAAPSLLTAPLSASAIQTYQRCPLQFKLERDWRLPADVPAALRFGAAMHLALKAFHDARLAGRAAPGAEALIEIFREQLAKEAIDNPLQAALYDRLGVKQLRAFVAGQQSEPPPRVLETEKWFEVALDGVRISGRMDRVDRGADGGIVITDYKTGAAWTQEDADESLQLSIYAMAAKLMGTRAEKLVLHNVENGTQVATTRTEEEIGAAEDQVREVAERIAAGDFEPKTHYQVCGRCGYRSVCPATEQRFHASAAKAAASR